jgi:hypothetical protein
MPVCARPAGFRCRVMPDAVGSFRDMRARNERDDSGRSACRHVRALEQRHVSVA